MKLSHILIGGLLVAAGMWAGKNYFSEEVSPEVNANYSADNATKPGEAPATGASRRSVDSIVYLTNSEQATIDLFEKVAPSVCYISAEQP